MLNNGATATEIRAFLVSGDNVPLTMRIPKPLRDSMKEAADHEGVSVTSLVKQCMLEKLADKQIGKTKSN